MQIAIFDDRPIDFYPVAFTRSVGDIRCGALKLRQRLQAMLTAEQDIIFIESRLVELYRERHPDWLINDYNGDCLLVNSCLKMDDIVLEQIRSIDIGMSLTDAAGRIIAMRTQLTGFHTPNELLSMAQKLKPTTCKAVLYSNMADLIMDNKRMIEYDFDQLFYDKDNYIETEMGVTVLNPYKVWIGEGTVLKPGVILDATSGPIIIDEEAEIMANAVIIGPAYIGKNTKIKIAAKIYEGTSIGPVCKIGGEVEGSIIQAYSNKQHDGFIGHAYLGEWVNLGADTNNSDLKNNYKPVSMYSYRSQTKVNAGYQFLGSVIADHVKTGINCSLNTGVVIGMGSNLWGKDLISDYIPDFSWGEAKSLSEYRLAAFIATARIVKQRRKMEVSDLEAELYTYISKL